jgi:hypothetical protein
MILDSLKVMEVLDRSHLSENAPLAIRLLQILQCSGHFGTDLDP